jgi:hypothetical protein
MVGVTSSSSSSHWRAKIVPLHFGRSKFIEKTTKIDFKPTLNRLKSTLAKMPMSFASRMLIASVFLITGTINTLAAKVSFSFAFLDYFDLNS